MSDPTTWSGRTLGGRYQIEERLGTGGMATVYKATDPNLKRVVAVKLIHPHLATDPEFVRRFEEEATAVAQLRHPHIVQVYDYNHEGYNYYIVFEFVPGETLQARLRRLNEAGRRLSHEEIHNIAGSMADALAYAHSRNLIHRDVKPANIMLNVYGQAILTDFGIAKIAGGATFTATGATIGTAQYMSPEQIKGERLDGRSDLYSLGVTMFEMVSGRRPFESDSAMTLMMMHVNDPVPDLRDLRPDTTPALTAVIEQALAKDPNQRFASAADLRAALERAKAAPPDAIPATIIEEATAVEQAPVVAAAATAAAATAAAATAADATRVDESPPRKPLRQPQVSGQPPVAGLGEPEFSPPPPTERKSRLPLYAGIGALALLLLIVAGVIGSSLLGGGEGSPTAVAQATATIPATEIGGVGDGRDTATPSSTPTATPSHTPTYTPSPSPTGTTTATPTATYSPPTATSAPPTATALAVRITNITQDNDGRYVVAYETTGYTETLPGMHVHFFFDTVTQANAGVPGSGPWILYGGPRPFTQYTIYDRPAAATQLCALVANPDHSIQMNSGNCYNLP